MTASLPGQHVTCGRSKRVHIIRPGTVYTMRGHGTTYCGYYGRPEGVGWMQLTDAEPSCKSCVARLKAAEAA